MERFAIPGAGAIIERTINGEKFILIQQRCKKDALNENNLYEIPAGKIREFESIFDCLKREVYEETGLTITEIKGEDNNLVHKADDYEVLNFTPFSCSQNLTGKYPIMCFVFICKADGEVLKESDESKNIKWIKISELKSKIENNPLEFYAMHVDAIRKYLANN